MTPRRTPKRSPQKSAGQLVAFPGCKMVLSCAPAGVKDDEIKRGLVTGSRLDRLGIPAGAVLVCRKPDPAEHPPPGAFCLLTAGGDRMAVWVERVTRRSVYLKDDTGVRRFERREVELLGVAQYVCTCGLLGRTCPRGWLGPSPWRAVDALEWPEVIAG